MSDDLATELPPEMQRYFDTGGDASAYAAEQQDREDEKREAALDQQPAQHFSTAADVARAAGVEQERFTQHGPDALRAEMIKRAGRAEARLELFGEATAALNPQPPQPQQQRPDWIKEDGYTVDPMKDPIGAIMQYQQERAQEREQQAVERGFQEFTDAYRQDWARVAQQNPDWNEAYRYLMHSRARELMAHLHPNATAEQLMRAPVPVEVNNLLVQEELDQVADCFRRGISPAEHFLRRAVGRGYVSPQMEADWNERNRQQAAADKKARAALAQQNEIARSEHGRRRALWDDHKMHDYTFARDAHEHKR
ncbi:MAG TPA: hypothetical protein VGJ20_28840 [Xanthobacteraceae bacterium]|jgi:hypothetical protein